MHTKQAGFSSLVILMAAIILILLGAVGWLTWDKMHSSSPKGNTAQSTAASSINGASAESLVSAFYQKYTDGNADRVSLIKQYGTDALLADWNAANNPYGVGEDPIICAQAIAPTTVTGHVANGSSVDVTVHEAFDTPRTLTVRVVDQNGLKIDHVSCPQQ